MNTTKKNTMKMKNESKKKNTKEVKPVKITWEMIYKDFKQRHPNLSKEVRRWNPLNFATIELHLKDGTRMSYDYDLHQAKFIGKEITHIPEKYLKGKIHELHIQ